MNKVKIAIFPPNTLRSVVLNANGYTLDNYCTNLRTTQDLKGIFRLEATFVNRENMPNIDNGCILKHLDEIYRITTCTKSTMITNIIAYQITITDTATSWIKDTRPTNTSCAGALNDLYESSDSNGYPKELFLSSNIDTISTAYYQKMSLHKAICDCDQSILNRWGGEVHRNQYNLKIVPKLGSENGIVIREGKNLTGFSANTNTDDLCTVALGIGANGIEGDYIESPLKSKYPRAYTKTISYSDIKVKSENDTEGFDTLEEAKSEINRRIKLEFSNNHIDEIKATYDIKLIDLARTEEYKDYAYLETVNLGDVVTVIVDSLNIRLKTRVIEVVRDISNNIVSLKLSNNPVDSSSSDSSILKEIKDIVTKNNNKSFIDYITAKIKSGVKGGYMLYNENELIASDNKDLNYAKNIARLNRFGLAFSQNGYNGDYEYGITIDGKINASCIMTGILSAILIQNIDGSFSIDLSKSGGALFRNNGKKAINIANNSINFYDWYDNEKEIGGLSSVTKTRDKTKSLLQLNNSKQSAISIAYETKDDSNKYTSYIEFDKYNILNNLKPIYIIEDVSMRNGSLYFGDKDENQFYNSKADYMFLKTKNGFGISDKDSGKSTFLMDGLYKTISASEWDTGNDYFYCGTTGFSLANILYTTTGNTIYSKNTFGVGGDLVVSGKKNRLVETEHYGKLAQNAYETCEAYFGDIGRAKLKNGKCIIRLDKKFLETVNTDVQYEVFVSPYGNGNVWVDTNKMYKQYVVVEGTADIEFAYEIKVKQKDYENIRLEEYK
ncbi:MAG: phage tail spike protein [Clostridium sp.]|uniref:phage tail spike protein n=1 Tax=Clostridia TaxID=186801 RepID=UPI003F38E69D